MPLPKNPAVLCPHPEDGDREGARALRGSPVAPARISESAKAKAGTELASDGLPVHGFTTLPAELATLTLNEATAPTRLHHHFPAFAQPTPLQSRAFKLPEIDPAKSPRDQTRRGCYMSSPARSRLSL